jgi:hypothetical protein
MMRLLVILGLAAGLVFVYVTYDPMIINRTDEYGVSGKVPLIDDNKWEFKHCTSNSNKNCGRLK